MSISVEALSAEIGKRHGLVGFHIFNGRGGWRVFGSHMDPKGYKASVDEGFGPTIIEALRDLDTRLIAGPHRANPVSG